MKAGPFSRRTPSGEGEIGLNLDVRKPGKDGFECRVNTIRYRKPGGSFLAEEGLHVITLEGSRGRDGHTLVLVKCHEPMVRDSVFVHFCMGMGRLLQEPVKPASNVVQAYPEPPIAGAVQPEEESMPAAEQSEQTDSAALDDDSLDGVDRKIIEVVEKLEHAGLRPTDKLVARRLPPIPEPIFRTIV